MKLNHYYFATCCCCFALLLACASADASSLWRPKGKVSTTTTTTQQQQPLPLWHRIPRGGGDDMTVDMDSTESTASSTTTTTTTTTGNDDSPTPVVVVKETPVVVESSSSLLSLLPMMISEALSGLCQYMKGPKADAMMLFGTTALTAPLCEKMGLSPILGFLSLGLLLGPNGQNLIQDVHTTELLADLGIVFFLFEMGLHVDMKTLLGPMKQSVFGIGVTQFSVTAIVIGTFCKLKLGLSTAAAVIVGWSLALSSSAFVLQLLKDKDEMDSNYGKSSFGTLLLQDLMVVPLLVMTPILAGSGGSGTVSVSTAISKAVVQIIIAVSAIVLFGKFAMNPLLQLASSNNSCCQESLVGMILVMVVGSSFLTEGLGLSNTLGPFLTGMLLSGQHQHAVEKEASPIRGILVGLFFFTVGFEIDLKLIRNSFGLVLSTVVGLMVVKFIIATVACQIFQNNNNNNWYQSQRVGMVLSQGGEFAFVAFRTARANGILSEEQTKLLLTCVSLTMALTPLAEEVGAQIAALGVVVVEDTKKNHLNNINNNNKKNK